LADHCNSWLKVIEERRGIETFRPQATLATTLSVEMPKGTSLPALNSGKEGVYKVFLFEFRTLDVCLESACRCLESEVCGLLLSVVHYCINYILLLVCFLFFVLLIDSAHFTGFPLICMAVKSCHLLLVNWLTISTPECIQGCPSFPMNSSSFSLLFIYYSDCSLYKLLVVAIIVNFISKL